MILLLKKFKYHWIGQDNSLKGKCTSCESTPYDSFYHLFYDLFYDLLNDLFYINVSSLISINKHVLAHVAKEKLLLLDATASIV